MAPTRRDHLAARAAGPRLRVRIVSQRGRDAERGEDGAAFSKPRQRGRTALAPDRRDFGGRGRRRSVRAAPAPRARAREAGGRAVSARPRAGLPRRRVRRVRRRGVEREKPAREARFEMPLHGQRCLRSRGKPAHGIGRRFLASAALEAAAARAGTALAPSWRDASAGDAAGVKRRPGPSRTSTAVWRTRRDCPALARLVQLVSARRLLPFRNCRFRTPGSQRSRPAQWAWNPRTLLVEHSGRRSDGIAGSLSRIAFPQVNSRSTESVRMVSSRNQRGESLPPRMLAHCEPRYGVAGRASRCKVTIA